MDFILQNVSLNNLRKKSYVSLHWAIMELNDIHLVTTLLNNGANVHAKSGGKKPLDIAIQYKRANIVPLLIDKGALDGENVSELLFKVIKNGSYEIVKTLIERGLQQNSLISLKKHLQLAISTRQPRIIELIIPHCLPLQPSERYIPNDVVRDYGLRDNRNCVEILLKWNFTMDPNSHHDNQYICSAVKEGYLPIVLELLERGIDVNIKDSLSNLTLLQMACMKKHSEMVENLLKHNARMDVTTPSTRISSLGLWCYHWSAYPRSDVDTLSDITCLHIAVYNNDPVTVRLLLRYGLRLIDDPTFFNITCIAVQYNHEEIVRIFLDHGVDVHNLDSEGNTLLHHCVSSRHDSSRYEIVQMLFERGADIYVRIPGSSLLFEAIENKHPDIARLFLNNHANALYISADGNNLLHTAIANNFDIEFIKFLLQKGVNPNAVNNQGLTPLHVICDIHYDKRNYRKIFIENLTEKIQLLLNNKGNIEAVDGKGRTPLYIACDKTNVEAFRCLVNNGANVDYADPENLTILYVAAMRSFENINSEIIEILLQHKANVHCMNNFKQSLIHVAVGIRNLSLIERLAHTQINLNASDLEGNTPLHMAIYYFDLDLMKTLIKCGANINILDKNNRTPLQTAIDLKNLMYNNLTKHCNYFDTTGFYSGYFDDVSYINTCKNQIRVLKTQVIKLKTAGLTVNRQNYNLVYNPNNNGIEYNPFSNSNDPYYVDCTIDVLQIELDCQREIRRMRMQNIGSFGITFYDLLKQNIHQLNKLVEYKQIEENINSAIFNTMFPLYIDIIRNRFREAKYRYRLLNSAVKNFRINIYQLSDDCVYNIFSYLNAKEMKMVNRALKPLNK